MTNGGQEPSTLLPPIPDRLVEARDKAAFMRWLGLQQIPPNYRARWLREWGAYTGVPVYKGDFDFVQAFP
jgi:hypothetical protein